MQGVPPEIAKILKQLSEGRDEQTNQLMRDSRQQVGEAPLAGPGNLSSALLCPDLMSRTFDVVIFCDAHWVGSREVVAIIGLATEAVCIIGDCRGFNDPGFGRRGHEDIFQFCGVTQSIDAGAYDPRLVPLCYQQDTHPDITQLVSRVAYGGVAPVRAFSGAGVNRLLFVPRSLGL